MKYKDLRDFAGRLETLGELRRIPQHVSPTLEMTEICDRVLRAGGPALLFESTRQHASPVLGNLFGTPRRVALGMGIDAGAENGDSAALESLRDVGRLLSALKEPEPPKGLKDAGKLLSLAKAVWDMAPKTVSSPPCQEIVWEGDDVDLAKLPIQTCWPGDAGPLITWGLTVTRGPNKTRQNLGIYRQQLIGRNKLIMRWLAHRGGALDFREFALSNPGKPYPVAVVLGADPATILGAVTPVPDTLSEYQFAGLLRGARTELARCLTPGVDTLQVPARAEIVLEGFIYPQTGTPAAAPAKRWAGGRRRCAAAAWRSAWTWLRRTYALPARSHPRICRSCRAICWHRPLRKVLSIWCGPSMSSITCTIPPPVCAHCRSSCVRAGAWWWDKVRWCPTCTSHVMPASKRG